MFPSVLNESISSSVLQPDLDSVDQDRGDINANGMDAGDAAAIAEAHQNALLTESDEEEYEEPEL